MFKLNGRINSNSGTIILLPVGDEIYYPSQKGFFETNVTNGQFTISKPCLYPYAFKIGLKINSEWVYISDAFWVDPGTQEITCNIDSSREIPFLNNITMRELSNMYATSFKSSELSSVANDSILLKYSKSTPNSFLSLWTLIDKFSRNGYQSIYDSIFNQFSEAIKNTYSGKVLAKKMISAKIARIGSVFPSLNLSDSKKQRVITLSNRSNKFTLIDFWHSHCGPCIGQFDTLKKLYSIYNIKGFSIIGISIDKKESIVEWKNLIKKHQLPWEQFLDLDGSVCSDLSIYVFPSNFLLNQNGEIIAKNVNTSYLASFLEMNLK